MFRKWLNGLRRDRRDAERYRRLRLVLQDADRWLSHPEFAQALAVVNWLQQGDGWHFDGMFLKRQGTPHYSQDIGRFRDELRAIGSVSDGIDDVMAPQHDAVASGKPQPHRYVPDAMKQGDCAVCGHVEQAEIHQ